MTFSNRSNSYVFWFNILIVAIVFDLIVPLILGEGYPNYNHFIDTISTLGIESSPVKVWARLSLMIVGILFVLFAYGQSKQFDKVRKYEKLYIIGVFLFGLGSLLAGIFPEDLQDIEEETINGKIHGIASFIGFVFLIFCSLWATKIKQITTKKWLNYILFIIATVSFVLFLISENIESGILKYTGLLQRVNLVFLYSSLFINYLKIKST